jgi:hypothetical protein
MMFGVTNVGIGSENRSEIKRYVQTAIEKAKRPNPVRAFLNRYGRRARRRAAPAR